MLRAVIELIVVGAAAAAAEEEECFINVEEVTFQSPTTLYNPTPPKNQNLKSGKVSELQETAATYKYFRNL